MPIALIALKARDQDERPIHPDDPDDIAQDVLAAPFVQRFVEPLRKAVIDHRGEVLPIDSVIPIGIEQFFGPYQTESVEELGADRVVAGFAAVQRHERQPHAVPAAEQREHASVLVVGMRRGVHRAGRRRQLEDFLPRSACARVLRRNSAQRCRPDDGRGERDEKKPFHHRRTLRNRI